MGRSLDELCEAISWTYRRSANPPDVWRNRQRHYWSRQSDMQTDGSAVSGVEQRQERGAARDPLGKRTEYQTLKVGCRPSDQATPRGGGGAISADPRRGTVADCRQLRSTQALRRSDALPDASAGPG